MQLFAQDIEGRITSVQEAERQKDYFCLECGAPVRKRLGVLRAHFFHLSSAQSCRLSAKSLTHLELQLHLQRLFGSASIERRFEEIGRIADVCIEERKLIFEIQCSPLPLEEVHGRMCAYGSLGYQVVWILHEQHFHPGMPIAKYLSFSPHFYTDFDPEKGGVIYDQTPCFVLAPEKIHPIPRRGVPALFKKRALFWPYYFEGERLSLALRPNRFL